MDSRSQIKSNTTCVKIITMFYDVNAPASPRSKIVTNDIGYFDEVMKENVAMLLVLFIA